MNERTRGGEAIYLCYTVCEINKKENSSRNNGGGYYEVFFGGFEGFAERKTKRGRYVGIEEGRTK